MSKPYFVYILRCEDNSLYTGITTDATRRYAEHGGKNGKGAKYTLSHTPIGTECIWTATNKSTALRLEYQIKALTKAKKENLIRDPALFDTYFGNLLDITQYSLFKKGVLCMKTVKDYVVTIPDFPEAGIMFRDITSVLQDADGLHLAIEELQKRLEGVEFDVIAGAESRGFVFGAPLAYNLHKPFVPIRKQGKLPREVVSEEYALEYGTATIEMHCDAIQPGQRVVLIDDLIATGGTMLAAAHLVEKLGGQVVKMLFLLELAGLEGRKLLEKYDVESVVVYEGK